MQVNKITSTKTQLPYRYYDLPFCKPSNVDGADLNLGQLLAGDSIESSDYKLFMKFHEYCKVLCVKQYTDKQAKKFASKIRVRCVFCFVFSLLLQHGAMRAWPAMRAGFGQVREVDDASVSVS